jgi:hypothetical protein
MKRRGRGGDLQKIVINIATQQCREPRNAPGILAGLIAQGLQDNCARCDSLHPCCEVLRMSVGAPVEQPVMISGMERCLACAKLDRCVQAYLEDYQLDNIAVAGSYYVRKFARCKAKKLQRRLLG